MKKNPSLLSAFSHVGFAIAAVCALIAVLSGLGNRLDWWHFRTGFTLLRWAAWGALTAVVISLFGGVFALRDASRGRTLAAVAGIILGFVVVGFPLAQMRIARQVPPIHDITTDTQNPPAFVALLPLRKGASNPASYDGAAVAAMQKKAYPDIRPTYFDAPEELVFEKALNAAQGMGWNVIAVERSEGRIEATDTTRWFGFVDDIVVRVTREAGKTRVDVRSKSRVGRSDVGTNARRIRGFFKRLHDEISRS